MVRLRVKSVTQSSLIGSVLVVAAPGGERFITVAPRLYLAIIDGELCGEEEGDK